MFAARGSIWGPLPLPEVLHDQLRAHGFDAEDAGRCARMINERPGGAATASLFVDLGGCKYLEGDIDGAIAAWRHALSRGHAAAAARSMLNLGLLYEHLRLFDHALGLFDAVTARDVDPYVVPAAMASARCHVAKGQAERAMETMARLAQRTMGQDPDDAALIAILFGLGEVAMHAGRVDRAERAWRVATVGPPSAVQRAARDRLIALLADHGRFGESLEVIGRERRDGDQITPTVLLDVADGLAASGDDRGAGTLVSNIDLAALDSATGFRLAGLRRRCGLVNEAIDVLEVLLARDDDEVQVQSAYLLGDIYRSFDMAGPARSMLGRVIDARHPYWTSRAEALLADLADEPDLADDTDEPDGAAALGDGVVAASGDDDEVVDLREAVVVALESDDHGATSTTRNGASAFADLLDGGDQPQNPYAALAPDEAAPEPSKRNPYAELAPGFDDGEFEPPDDIEPGDWQSMLEDWPPPAKKKRSSAFSRYT